MPITLSKKSIVLSMMKEITEYTTKILPETKNGVNMMNKTIQFTEKTATEMKSGLNMM